uniref:Response regulator n=1 Tax=candidate division WOR-3 bacterium TaxID=2052148 RepID=A0A7V4E2T5_UNCW3
MNKIKILLVDDDYQLGFTLKSFLEINGFSVEYAENGFLALEKLENGNFQLVIMDILMPGIDGIEVYKRLKENKKEIKIIFISAYIPQEKKAELKNLGIEDYLEKPFALEELVEKINNLGSLTEEKNKPTCYL